MGRIQLDNPTTHASIVLVVVIKSFVEIVYDTSAALLVLVIFLGFLASSPSTAGRRHLDGPRLLLAVLDAARLS